MRIQHNIIAMNSYRNYNNNVGALSKNLEKLSSGYRINRAGDDAAGLAISEKMRAQITGLNAAQKNVKDGINLVKTAEGAMQEIQDMLNRMKYLAVQSANGTYEDEVDRENLQKEVDALKTEINRIADSANFNGRKLLDGSLAAEGSTSKAVTGSFDSIKGTLAAGIADVDATKSKSAVNLAQLAGSPGTWTTGDKITLELGTSDGQIHNIELTATVDKDGKTTLATEDGSFTHEIAANSGAAATIADTDIQNALKAAVEASDLGDTYAVTIGSNKMTLEAKTAGAGVPTITSVGMDVLKTGGTVSAVDTTKLASVSLTTTDNVTGEDAYQALDLSKAVVYDGTNLDKATFEINGEKFVFVSNGKVDDTTIAAMKEAGISHYVEAAGTTVAAGDVTKMAEKIQMATGLDVTQGTVTAGPPSTWADGTSGVSIKLGDGIASKASGGLTLQIGDTADEYNQMSVHVNDMHVSALGLDSFDISTLSNAQKAEVMVRDAINQVSSTRGDLGAIQNRLEHTANNLSVMEENIQDAESNIRDTDVADEMMAYTKNNILIQSAQAMLAQANAVPQGVLQLLQ